MTVLTGILINVAKHLFMLNIEDRQTRQAVTVSSLKPLPHFCSWRCRSSGFDSAHMVLWLTATNITANLNVYDKCSVM